MIKNIFSKTTAKLFTKLNIKRWPSFSQWKNLPSLFSNKERYFILGAGILAIISLIGWYIAYQLTTTIVVPKHGGSYTEGIIGTPQYINPVLCQTSDADRDLTELIFSGLMKYDSEGKLVPDLAERYAVGDEGKVYEFFLRKGVTWHDGESFNADDVVFTIQIIQNPDFKSPLFSIWHGIEIEKVNDYTVRFHLKEPYAPFIFNTTVGILPKHIWENINPPEFFLTDLNLKPIGTGPYKLRRIEKGKEGTIKTVQLESYENYHFGEPFIKKIVLKFYINEENLVKAYNKGEVEGLGFISAQNLSKLKNKEIALNILELNLPRYFAVFLNQSKSKILSDKTVRLALNYATDKDQIIKEILMGRGTPVYSPIPKGVFGHSENIKIYDFALEHAKNLLEAAGWKENKDTGFREKVLKSGEDSSVLSFTLITTDWPELEKVANLLKEQWEKIGAKVDIKILNIAEIQQNYIRPREYEALIFGEVLGPDPDPLPFWHSSQKKDPGLNLALYQNNEADKILTEARTIFDPEKRKEKYEEFQKLVVDDAPVIFLYNPYYLYSVDKKIKGIKIKNIPLPSKRFSGIENWYIKTKRIKKESN